jgi:hypothetical protein
MKPAEDAVVLDTTVLDAEAAYAVAMERIRGIGAGNPAEQ